MDVPERGLVSEDLAAYYTGRPASTIRRWAAEGRIARYGSGRGKVRYSVFELPHASRDEYNGDLLAPGGTPPMPQRSPKAA